MKIAEILATLDRLCPFRAAAPWDNPGLLLGDMEREVSGVLVALDLTGVVIDEAKAQGLNLILTHHPFIFTPQPHIIAGTYEGDMALALAKNDMATIACHTNWDNAPGGINYALCEALGLQNIRPLLDPALGAEILLLAGEFATELSAAEMTALVAKALGQSVIRAAGLFDDKKYKRLAVCGGAAMDFWRDAYALGCDALLSADPKHHEGLQAAERGFAVLDGTHFATEIIGIRRLAHLLKKELPELNVMVANDRDSWQFYDKSGQKI